MLIFSRWCYSTIFGSFHLRCLWLCFETPQSSPLRPVRGVTGGHVITACVFMIHSPWSCCCRHYSWGIGMEGASRVWGYLGHEHCFLGRGRRRLSGGGGTFVPPLCMGFSGSWVLPPWAGGWSCGLWMARRPGVAGPADTAACFSVVVVAAGARGSWYRVYHLCCCSWVPGASGSTTLAWRLRLWVLPVVPVLPVGLLCPPTDVQMYGCLWCPGMSGRGTFVELWIFYWL